MMEYWQLPDSKHNSLFEKSLAALEIKGGMDHSKVCITDTHHGIQSTKQERNNNTGWLGERNELPLWAETPLCGRRSF